MATYSFVKAVSKEKRQKLEKYTRLGFLGRFLIKNYFNSDSDIIVIGRDSNYWAYSAWINYLRLNETFNYPTSSFGIYINKYIDYLDLYVPFEEAQRVYEKLLGLGRNDDSFLSCLEEYFKSVDQPGWLEEVRPYAEDYFEYIEEFRQAIKQCVEKKFSLVIWTPA